MWSAEELRGWGAASWPEWDWSAAVIEHGSFHQVVVSAGAGRGSGRDRAGAPVAGAAGGDVAGARRPG